MKFAAHPNAEARRRSAALLVRLLLENNTPEMEQDHIRELLDTLIWKITEADGKYKTRYQSRGALDCKDKKQLRHEHVYLKSKIIDELMRCDLQDLDRTLEQAIGCTVTREEHLRLSKFDRDHSGGERYRKAGVGVIDTQTGSEHIPPRAEN